MPQARFLLNSHRKMCLQGLFLCYTGIEESSGSALLFFFFFKQSCKKVPASIDNEDQASQYSSMSSPALEESRLHLQATGCPSLRNPPLYHQCGGSASKKRTGGLWWLALVTRTWLSTLRMEMVGAIRKHGHVRCGGMRSPKCCEPPGQPQQSPMCH